MAQHFTNLDWVYYGPVGGTEVYVYNCAGATETVHLDDTFWDWGQAPTEQSIKGIMIANGKTELPWNPEPEEPEEP